MQHTHRSTSCRLGCCARLLLIVPVAVVSVRVCLPPQEGDDDKDEKPGEEEEDLDDVDLLDEDD